MIYAPVDNGFESSAYAVLSNPVVDLSSGRLYIPFLHISYLDSDAIKVLVSDDGGKTFRFLAFNVPGWPDPTGFPTVNPGAFTDCGSGSVQLTLHQGPARPGLFDWAVGYTQATRVGTQPTAAAADGRLLIAFNSSTSPSYGDPSSGSEIHLLYSPDGGRQWAPPLVVASSTSADPQHAMPSIALDADDHRAFVAYYVQQSDERFRTDVAAVRVTGRRVALEGTYPLGDTAFDLAPTNIPWPTAADPFATTSYDQASPCYDLGDYMSVAVDRSGEVRAAWGDDRRKWTGPPGSPAPYTHSQPDVFFGRLAR
jgi:hypothetical protein